MAVVSDPVRYKLDIIDRLFSDAKQAYTNAVTKALGAQMHGEEPPSPGTDENFRQAYRKFKESVNYF
jgi:hypothetical protein